MEGIIHKYHTSKIYRSISEEVTEDVHALVIGSSMEDGSDVRDSPQYEAANWLDTRVYTETEFDEFLFTSNSQLMKLFFLFFKKKPERQLEQKFKDT